MNKTIRHLLAAGMIILPVCIILLFWDQIPENVPIHWNIKGEPDSYVPKAWGMFIGPVTMFVLYLLFLILPWLDPKKKLKDSPGYGKLQMAMMLAFFGINIFQVGVALDVIADSQSVFLIVFFIIMIIGNYLGKIRPNYFIGVKTPWTLESPEVWRKTHRLTGHIWVFASLLMVFLYFVVPKGVFHGLIIAYLIAIIIVPIAYSFVAFRSLPSQSGS